MQVTEDGVQKLFKRYGLFSLVVLLITSACLQAESFADFKKTQISSFESFKDERDKEFNSYLKQQWQEYEAFSSGKLYERPKPKSINPLPELKIAEVGPRVDIGISKEPEQNTTLPIAEVSKKDVEFDFFGTDLGFDIDLTMKDAHFYPHDQNGVIGFFKFLATSEYEPLLSVIQEKIEQFALNDWGVYQLVRKVSQSVYNKPDEQNLLIWFLLNKLSYDVKIGLVQKHIVLLHNSKQVVYATPRYNIEGKYYYAIAYQNQAVPGHLFTYDKNYPQADKKLNFELSITPNFAQNIQKKQLSFMNGDKKINLNVSLNKNLIQFMNTYPQVDYDVYFNANFDPLIYSELSNDLRKYINGNKASYGLNFLLHFVQKSFKYQRDDEQFGKDKVMFAEETLFYDRSDCEDRAILFAKLVRKIFNYGVVGVQYKDHMSTALYIPLNGDSVKFGTKKYVIADPTYINANIGLNMPKYKSMQPESFIRLQ